MVLLHKDSTPVVWSGHRPASRKEEDNFQGLIESVSKVPEDLYLERRMLYL